ncbi:MAG TPA: ATP-binding protein [Pyrinomonadaceae bacterium]|jgi:signal transduction histidine kinase/HAMP domain-containing protein
MNEQQEPQRPTGLIFDVRAKLLVMLALLSLPLLIISLVQLRSYQRTLNEQAVTIARIETAAAASSLESWIEANRPLAEQPAELTPAIARELYGRLQKHSAMRNDATIIVLDAHGHIVPNPSDATPVRAPNLMQSEVVQQTWNDNIRRVTSVKRLEPFRWSVAVGVPLPENTPAGRGILALTATWALALLSSSLLGIWAVGRFTKPLRQLAATASTLGQGQLQERVAVETQDEVGTLATSFNTMASSLQTKFEEVRAQGAFIEEVLDSLPLGVAVLDASLIVRRANATFARFVGRDAATQLAGRGLYEAAAGLAVLSEIVEDVRRTRRAFVNYGLPLELVARNKEADENTKHWDVTLWPISHQSEGGGDLILILSEVSKRVRAEKLATSAFAAEKARAAELELVINQMTEGVIIVDARGRYRVNLAAARILGRQPGEFRDGVEALITDMALHDLQRNQLTAAETPLGRALVRGERVAGEHVLIKNDEAAEDRVLEISVTPLVGGDDGRRHEGVVAVFHDVTEEVRQHTAIVEAYDRLREHDRLKSAFVANVSHELRTPLNVIIGLCQLLSRDRQLPLAPLQGEAVMRMERNAHNLLELVNDLLDYSRLEAGRSALHLEHVELTEIINEVVKGYEPDARDKRIELKAEVAPDLGTAWTDRHKLSQVLSNLVSNAIKFTSTGTVTVIAAPFDDERWYMEVRDTGIGMSSDALGYIFDGFRQVDDRLARSYSGVGLGLAITRKIVELLEGDISVESRQNEGSRFRITWPRAARPRTGTGSLIADKKMPAPADKSNLRARAS